jgi:3-methyladenine DNA glycosylase Mpg
VKIMRAVLIVSLGIITGYRAVSSDRIIRELLLQKYTGEAKVSGEGIVSGQEEDSQGLEGDEFIAYQTLTNHEVKDTSRVINSIESEKTWKMWFAKKLKRQVPT